MEKKYNENEFEIRVAEENDYINRLSKKVDSRLLLGFFECSRYVAENCNFDMEARELATVSTEHIDYWVEDGVLYLGKSKNGNCGYSEVLSTIGTDEYSQGSCQENPHRYEGLYAFENLFLLIFLKKWNDIKKEINIRNEIYNNFKA